jgi:hypothetical protein
MRFIRNKVLAGLAVAAAVVLLCFPAATQAQTVNLKVTIPFDFHVGNQTLPSGAYIVRNMDGALRISDSSGHLATVMSIPVSGPSIGSRNAIVFSRYGNDYFLKEARWEGYNNARGVLKSKRELDLARATPAAPVNLAGIVR